MKSRILSYVLSSLPLLLWNFPALGQNTLPLTVGITGGGELSGLVEGRASVYSGGPGCGVFSSGSSSSVRFGGVLSAPSFFSPRFGLALRPGWRSSTVRFSVRPDDPPWVYDAAVDQAVEEEREFRLQVASQTLSLALLATFRIGERFGIGIGPEIGYRISQSVRQTDHILGPDNLAFPDGQTVRDMPDAPSYSANPFGAGLTVAGHTTIPIGPRLSILLEASATADILSPVREAEWRSLSFGGTAGIAFALTKEKEIILPPPLPDVIEPTVPPLPLLQLHASIEVFGLEGNQRRDVITSRFREKEYCRSLRLVPEVVFEKGKTELPDLYQGKGMLPALDSLASLEPSVVQNHLLHVIALRLANNPESTITLRPAGTESRLGEERCAAIRNYLSGVWSISPERIIVEKALTADASSGRDTKDRSERVIIASSSGLLSPVITRRLDRDFEAPLVKVTTSHQADAGLRAWEIILASRERTIARYSSAGSSEEGSGSMNWNMIYDNDGNDSSTITARFMVEDSTGGRKSVQNEASLLMLRSRIAVAQAIDMEANSETLFFRLDHSGERRRDSLGYEDLLREIDGSLRHGGIVSIAEEGSDSSADASFPSLRNALNELLRRHGVEEPAAVSTDDIIAAAADIEGCMNSEKLSGAALIVTVRQAISD